MFASASTLGARDFDSFSDHNLSHIPDRRGNFISVSNRSNQIRLTSSNHHGIFNWDVLHNDGYVERATTFYIDSSGSPILVGVRLVRGVNYVWLMKYSSSGQMLWENIDSEPGCTAFAVVAAHNGNIWVAASCADGGNYPARLMLFNSAGHHLWSYNYTEGGRNYVRNLTQDFMGRVSLSIEINKGDRTGRTLVFDANGTRLATY